MIRGAAFAVALLALVLAMMALTGCQPRTPESPAVPPATCTGNRLCAGLEADQ